MILGPTMPNPNPVKNNPGSVGSVIKDFMTDKNTNSALKNMHPNTTAGTGELGIGATSGRRYSGEGDKYNAGGQDVSFLTNDPSGGGGGGGGHTSSSKSKKEEFDWLNAELAKHYGMTKETGYAEAMDNTAYQRAVKDMKAAGLNPAILFANNSGDAAGSGQIVRSFSGGGGGGGGGYGRSYGSARSNKLFSNNAYAGIAGAGAVIGAVIGGVTSKSAFGVSAGAAAGGTIATSIAKVANALLNK